MKNVLVIDDDAAIGAALKRVLERSGHAVRTAATAADGLSELRARGADIVITDIVMPWVNGVDLIKSIAREFPWVRIVAMSGGGTGDIADYKPHAITTSAYLAAARTAGAHAVLTKPFQTRDVFVALGRSVLIIDDEPSIQHALQRVLEHAGFAVRTASNGSAGLTELKAQPADIVITDIIMPHLNGVEVIRLIARDFPGTRIVAISGGGSYGMSEYKPGAITTTAYLSAAQIAGAHAVLTKPFELQDVLRAIGHLEDRA